MTTLDKEMLYRLGSDSDQSERRRNVEQVSTHSCLNMVDCNVVDRCKKKHKYIRLPIVSIFADHQRRRKSPFQGWAETSFPL